VLEYSSLEIRMWVGGEPSALESIDLINVHVLGAIRDSPVEEGWHCLLYMRVRRKRISAQCGELQHCGIHAALAATAFSVLNAVYHISFQCLKHLTEISREGAT
jgi:hypothetical protein